jgi:hypothetical protein
VQLRAVAAGSLAGSWRLSLLLLISAAVQFQCCMGAGGDRIGHTQRLQSVMLWLNLAAARHDTQFKHAPTQTAQTPRSIPSVNSTNRASAGRYSFAAHSS